jgi:hypothetical protein
MNAKVCAAYATPAAKPRAGNPHSPNAIRALPWGVGQHPFGIGVKNLRARPHFSGESVPPRRFGPAGPHQEPMQKPTAVHLGPISKLDRVRWQMPVATQGRATSSADAGRRAISPRGCRHTRQPMGGFGFGSSRLDSRRLVLGPALQRNPLALIRIAKKESGEDQGGALPYRAATSSYDAEPGRMIAGGGSTRVSSAVSPLCAMWANARGIRTKFPRRG